MKGLLSRLATKSHLNAVSGKSIDLVSGQGISKGQSAHLCRAHKFENFCVKRISWWVDPGFWGHPTGGNPAVALGLCAGESSLSPA